MRQILLVSLDPSAPARVDVAALRDYCIESILKGVLVLGPGATAELMDVPDVEPTVPVVQIEPMEVGTPPPDPEPEADSEVAAKEDASVAAEKSAIHARLYNYRQANGLGCFAPLARRLRCKQERIRGLYDCTVHGSVEEWRRVARALDALEGESK